ncbi:MAG: hypothetical protein U0802_14710 [Candidatus Binatia bacterium]
MTDSWYHSAPLTVLQLTARVLPVTVALVIAGALLGIGAMLKFTAVLHGPQPT